MRRAVIMAEGSTISSEDLGLGQTDSNAGPLMLDLRTMRDRTDKSAIIAALGRVNGNMVRAAELLGVSRPTLYDLMHRLSLK